MLRNIQLIEILIHLSLSNSKIFPKDSFWIFLGFKILCIQIMLFSSLKGNYMETCFGCVVHAGQSTKWTY